MVRFQRALKIYVRRIRAVNVTKAVDQPIKMMPLMPSIAETKRHRSTIAASLYPIAPYVIVEK